MIYASSNEEFRRWNKTFIDESVKMIRLVLVLLIIWTFITVVWTVHLIIQASSRSDRKKPVIEYARRYRRSTDGWKFEELVFHTNATEVNWHRIKTLVGSLHQLREAQGKVPELTIYNSKPLDPLQVEESSAWNKVTFNRAMDKNQFGIWIADGYAFDPVALDLRRAELLSEAEPFLFAFSKGRRVIELIADDCMDLIDEESNKTVLMTNCAVSHPTPKKKKRFAHDFGLKRIEMLSTKGLDCRVDLKREAVENGAELVDAADIEELKQVSNRISVKKLVIGVPTTSKGMKSFKERHVLLTGLIPSLKATIESSELEEFKIVVMIGFDHGDLYFEDYKARELLKKEIKKLLPEEVDVMFLRLKPLKRVAMTWNMIFALARKHVRFDYFYQVNDDLTIKTSGWLKKFSARLDENAGIGVAGPSDSFNGFSCSLLTQAFVTFKHFEFFSGLMYPLAFRDWKSDRWLSFVYGRNRTFCWEKVEARNGGKGTRYEACPFGEWKIELERGRRTLLSAMP